MDYNTVSNIPITIEMRQEIESTHEELSRFAQSFDKIKICVYKKTETYQVGIFLSSDHDQIEHESLPFLDFSEALEEAKANLLSQILMNVVLAST
jgi:ribosome-associated translation inhibitor RaiA